ncbi:MAG: methyltransferase domain-containing protein, partial [Acetobacteraceae bacterium]|nr:methyltransferase domain-containing protein [Acetobacteraceae bacterium]
MTAAPVIFDRRAVRRHRDRAAPYVGRVSDLLANLSERLIERLDDVTRSFRDALDIGGRGSLDMLLRARGFAVISTDLSPPMAHRNSGPRLAADEEFLPFAPASFDLVIACVSLHWVNDLPGALLQIRRTLRPGGLFLGSLPVLGTLEELRSALTEAEAVLTGGSAPRVSPFPALGDCAGLLQRAGFLLPVADLETVHLSYADGISLLRDLRAAGETNALALRDRRTRPRELFAAALARMAGADGRISVTLQLATMTGWAPG